ncbi:hypothetical protein ACIA5E_22090 [Nocardia asteroides]|uniref:hypothetical protein n=1 Tax=Nocardia asteroides TaxID=1824 RepID=UPI0037AED139
MSDFITGTFARCWSCGRLFCDASWVTPVEFTDEAEAAAYFDRPRRGWTVGAEGLVCSTCLLTRACLESGHEYKRVHRRWRPFSRKGWRVQSWWMCLGCGTHSWEGRA